MPNFSEFFTRLAPAFLECVAQAGSTFVVEAAIEFGQHDRDWHADYFWTRVACVSYRTANEFSPNAALYI